jgi:hypothetical protein
MACSTVSTPLSANPDSTGAGASHDRELIARCEARGGRLTTVAGVAKDAKQGAVLVSDDPVTYVRGLALQAES